MLMQERIEELRADAARMAGKVQQQVADAVEAFRTGNLPLAQQVIARDRAIDQDELQIERAAIDLLSLHQPLAGEFRIVVAVIKVNNDLERIADCASNVAGQVKAIDAEHLSDGVAYAVPKELVELGLVVVELVRQAVRTFNYADHEQARHVISEDNRVDALYASIVQSSLTDMRQESGHVSRDMAHVMIAKNLERIGDHCTNIAEDIVYATSGEIIRHRHAG